MKRCWHHQLSGKCGRKPQGDSLLCTISVTVGHQGRPRRETAETYSGRGSPVPGANTPVRWAVHTLELECRKTRRVTHMWQTRHPVTPAKRRTTLKDHTVPTSERTWCGPGRPRGPDRSSPYSQGSNWGLERSQPPATSVIAPSGPQPGPTRLPGPTLLSPPACPWVTGLRRVRNPRDDNRNGHL